MVLVYPQMHKHATRFHRSHSLSWETTSPTSVIPSLTRASTLKISPHIVTSVSPTHRIPSPTVSIRPPLLRRSAVHIQSPTFTRVTRRRLSSPQHTTLSSSSSPQQTTAPPPSPSPSPSPSSQLPPSPRPRRVPRRFTFAPIHVLTSRMRDTDVIDTEITDEPLTPAVDLVSWWSERETPVWKPPPTLHTVIEDEWEEQQPTITTTTTSSSFPTTTTSSQSQTTPIRPPPILLPHTISSAPPFQFMPLTPTRSPSSILELSTPPTCVDVEAALISPSFAQLSMNPKYCDLMQPLSTGWQETSRLTPGTLRATPETSQFTPVSWMNQASWTPSHINDVTEEIGNWIGEMDTTS